MADVLNAVHTHVSYTSFQLLNLSLTPCAIGVVAVIVYHSML